MVNIIRKMRKGFVHLCVVLIVFACMLSVVQYNPWNPYWSKIRPKPSPGTHDSAAREDGEWSFNYTKDWKNYGLSIEECDVAFPMLYDEIHRAAGIRKNDHITPDHLNGTWRRDAFVRAMIYDDQVLFEPSKELLRAVQSVLTRFRLKLYIIQAKGVDEGFYRSRSLAILHSIQRAIIGARNRDDIPNIEFTFVVDDMADPAHTDSITWALSRRADWRNLWLMPDFGFWSWPEVKVGSYTEVQQKILDREEAVAFEDKIWQLVWRGSVSANPRLRGDLLEVTKDKEWSDVQPIDWRDGEDLKNRLLSIDDHCQYMFIAHTEGRSYSGRLKYVQGCHSVIVAPRFTWIQHHHHLLISSGQQQNFVQVKPDFGDLESKMNYYLVRLDVSRRIADNSVKTFRERYLTPAASACYWRKLFREWANVSFEPDFFIEVEVLDRFSGKTRKERQWRGVPFESYVITGAVEWEIS